MFKTLALTFGLATALSLATAHAQTAEVALDFVTTSGIDAAANPGFGGATHTGSLLFQKNSSTVVGLFIDNVGQGSLSSPLSAITGSTQLPPYDAAGELILLNGQVDGGAITVTLANGDAFEADFVAGSGGVVPVFTGTYFITGDLANVSFNGPSFGGVDVSAFQGTFGGDFVLSPFTPGPDGSTDTPELDLRLNVPEPASIALIGLGGAMLLARRRR